MDDAEKSRSEELIRAHYEELDRIGYIDSPRDTLRSAIDHLVFALYISEAIRSGSITAANLKQVLRVHTGGPGLTIQKVYSEENVRASGWNLLLGALAVSAQAADRAMDQAFGSRPLNLGPAPRPEELSELDAARVILYMIRCAFAHDPFNPHWACRGAYQGQFRVESIDLTLDTGALNGERLKPEDHGGVEGYVALLFFCLEHLEANTAGSNIPEEP